MDKSVTSDDVTPASDMLLLENEVGQLNMESEYTTGDYLLEEESDQPESPKLSLELLQIIREALDKQTQVLFEQYAIEQHPKDPQKQKDLVIEMQEQNYCRYMTSEYNYQLMHQKQQRDSLYLLSQRNADLKDENVEDAACEKLPDVADSDCPLIPAILWTRSEIQQFKEDVWDNQRECCIKISSLSTATIRVPTHANGRMIFWEFATDKYDLGFGLYFEWDLEPPHMISITVSDSSDDEDDEDGEENGNEDDSQTNSERKQLHPTNLAEDCGTSPGSNDVERGHRSAQPRPPTDELIPIYRRDCHKQVFCGSHDYPGRGLYVFKFDNSYSLWRPKWLYYRIYYTE